MWRAAGGQSDWFPSLCNATDIPAAVSVAASGGAREGSGWPVEAGGRVGGGPRERRGRTTDTLVAAARPTRRERARLNAGGCGWQGWNGGKGGNCTVLVTSVTVF